MAKDPTKKQYLDYDGLGLFWGKIKENFARKSEALNTLSVVVDETDKNKVVIVGAYGDSTDENPHIFTSDALPTASSTQAGLMTKEQATTLAGLVATGGQENIIEGIQIEGNNVSLNNKLANLGLKYESKLSDDGKKVEAFISLVDLNGGDAISEIPVTELTKTGILAESTLVVDPEGYAAGTYLKLGFNTVDAEGNISITYQYINVTDLIDVYTGGEGITVSDKEISLKAASANTLGGIKTGYAEIGKNYAVKLDNDNAYVTVNWVETEVNVKSGSENYLNVDSSPSADKTTYTIGAGAGLTEAINKANSAIQSIKVLGKTLTATDDELTVEDASGANALDLKTAAHKDITATIGAGSDELVATSSAVKSYVDGAIDELVKVGGVIETEAESAKNAAIDAAKKYTDDEIAKFVPLLSADIDEICKF